MKQTLRSDPRKVVPFGMARVGPDTVAAVPPPYIELPLHAEYRAGRRYELMAPFRYVSAVPGVGGVSAPAGEVTDFHSTPRALWWLLPPDDWAEAAVAHDLLCRTLASDLGRVTRLQADRVHRECLLYLGAPAWRARLMYAGLRAHAAFKGGDPDAPETMPGDRGGVGL